MGELEVRRVGEALESFLARDEATAQPCGVELDASNAVFWPSDAG